MTGMVDSGPLGFARQRRRGANSVDDQLHSIISLAWARSDGGMLRPSALAVLRLITRETPAGRRLMSTTAPG